MKIVPSDARIAFGLNRSVRGSAAITASAPAPSAERRIAPRLPGFSTPSMTTTSGSSRGACRSSSPVRRRLDDRDDPVRAVAERRRFRAPPARPRRVVRADRRRRSAAAMRVRRPAAGPAQTKAVVDLGRRPRGPGAARGRHRPASGPVASRSRRSRSRTAALTRGFARLVIGPRRASSARRSSRRDHAGCPAERQPAPLRGRRDRRRRPSGGAARLRTRRRAHRARSFGVEAGVWAVSSTKASAVATAAHGVEQRRQRLGRAPSAPPAARAVASAGRGRSRRSGGRAAPRARRSGGVVDEPADRPVGEARTARRCGAPTRPPVGGVDVGHRARRPRPARASRPGVREQVQDASAPGDRRPPSREPRPRARVLREQPDLAARGRAELERQRRPTATAHGDRPRPGPARARDRTGGPPPPMRPASPRRPSRPAPAGRRRASRTARAAGRRRSRGARSPIGTCHACNDRGEPAPGRGRTDDHRTEAHSATTKRSRSVLGPARGRDASSRRRLHERRRLRRDDPARGWHRRRPRRPAAQPPAAPSAAGRLQLLSPERSPPSALGLEGPDRQLVREPTPFSWLAGDDGFGLGIGEQAPTTTARTSITARRCATRNLMGQLSVARPTATMRRAIGPKSGRGGVAGGDWNTPYPKRWRRHGSMRT